MSYKLRFASTEVDMKRRRVDLSEFSKADSSTERLNSGV